MAPVIYSLCALTSFACCVLLWRGWRAGGNRLLFWSALCFFGLSINNVLLVLDKLVFPTQVDLSTWRLVTALIAVRELGTFLGEDALRNGIRLGGVPSLVPASWQLIRRSSTGTEQVVASHVVPLPSWTAVVPAEPVSRALPPYDDALTVLASRPVAHRLRSAVGLFAIDGRAIAASNSVQLRARPRESEAR